MKTFYSDEVILASISGNSIRLHTTDSQPFRELIHRVGHAGQRFMCVLVEIDDDGSPNPCRMVEPDLRRSILYTTSKMLHRFALGNPINPANQAGMACHDIGYGWWMYSQRNKVPEGEVPRPGERMVAEWLRETFAIESRAELRQLNNKWHAHLEECQDWIERELDGI